VDRDSLWFRALPGRYGVEGGMLREGRRDGSTQCIRGGWFSDHVSRGVRNGKHTFFLVECVVRRCVV
jgi:hypothetical protein